MLGIGVYLALKPEQSNYQQTQYSPTTTTARQSVTPTKLQPKRTVPTGNLLGDTINGNYYLNSQGTLESGVAYKYGNSNRVYIYDGNELHPVANPTAYFNFYGCSGKMRVIDCAPVYLITEQKPIGEELR